MIGFYPYLISSLPFLEFGQSPPWSEDDFLGLVARYVSLADYAIIENLVKDKQPPEKHPVVEKWNNFEVALRNELARVRAARKRVSFEKYLRLAKEEGPNLSDVVAHALRNPNPIEVEKALDLLRWDFLNQLSFRNCFDLAAIVVYALKLRILWRWEKIKKADSEALLRSLLK